MIFFLEVFDKPKIFLFWSKEIQIVNIVCLIF